MSIDIMIMAWEDPSLDPLETLVALTIADGAGCDGCYKLDMDSLCRKAKMPAEGVSEIIDQLVSNGFIRQVLSGDPISFMLKIGGEQ